MDNDDGSDKKLLDRLNALKGGAGPGSGLSLDRSTNALNVSVGVERAKPPSKEDALAARLRSLRNTPEREDAPSLGSGSAPEEPRKPSALAAPGAPLTAGGLNRDTEPSGGSSTSAAGPEHAVDPLLDTDDQTLEDLLKEEGLGDDEGVPEWARPQQQQPDIEPERVEALLAELSKGITPGEKTAPGSQPSRGTHAHAQDATEADREGPNPDEESDGEEMSRDVHRLLSQALDEAELNARLNPGHDTDTGAAPGARSTSALGVDQSSAHRSQSSPTNPGGEVQQSPEALDTSVPVVSKGLTAEDAAGGLALPSVPSAVAAAPSQTDDAGLSLPSVPSVVGAASAANTKPDNPRSSADFEDDLAARMAALSVPTPKPKSGGDDGDGGDIFGLPSVPTSKPVDRSHVKRLTTRTGYTDEDQATWCTVCLEDATLRCLGCDNDVYCTRCWREMHVGPAAAFDDRTHKAVLFDKDQKKKDREKRTLVGA